MASLSKRNSPISKNQAVRKGGKPIASDFARQGLRPIQIWVPDTRSRKFAAQAARGQSRTRRIEHSAPPRTRRSSTRSRAGIEG